MLTTHTVSLFTMFSVLSSVRSTAGLEGRTLTTAEWIKGVFAQGMVYTRLFDEKLGVSQKARSIAAKVSVG